MRNKSAQGGPTSVVEAVVGSRINFIINLKLEEKRSPFDCTQHHQPIYIVLCCFN
jgi:hypothetical protein